MASWDLRRLQHYLEKNEPQGLYALIGDEDFLVEESLNLLREKALTSETRDFNYDCFFAGEASASQVRDAVETLPILCPRRLVVVKDVHVWKDEDWVSLLPVLESPVTSATLVVCGEKLDKRKKSSRMFEENGVFLDLKRPYENQIPVWIEYISKKVGVHLSQEMISLVHYWVGNSLYEIRNELLKLKEYLGDRREATVQDVKDVLVKGRMESVFNLADAVGNRDRAQALAVLVQLLDQGQNEIGIVALVQRHFRILLKLKSGLDEGLSGTQLSTRAGVPPFFLKQYLPQVRNWTEADLSNALEALYQTDFALKSSPVSGPIWLENLVLNLCAPR